MVNAYQQQVHRLQTFVLSLRRLWLFVFIVIILSLSIGLIRQSLSIPFAQYQDYRDKIVRLQDLEANFSQEVLTARYELFSYYDPIVNNLAEQNEIQQQLKIIPAFVDMESQQTIQQILEARNIALGQKENLSEWFKSRNALLKNSLRYLPFLTDQLEGTFAGQQQLETLDPEQSAALGGVLNQLIRNLLLFNITVDDSLTLKLETLMQKLIQLESTLDFTEDEVPTQLFRSHANVIVKSKPLLEELTSQLIAPLEAQTEALDNTFENSYRSAVSTTKRYRFATYGWFILLLVLGNLWLLQRLRQSNPLLKRYQKKVDFMATALTKVLQSQSLSEAQMIAKLEALAQRQDELGILAQGVAQVEQRLAAQSVREECFSAFTARLSLLTRNRTKLLTYDLSAPLEAVVKDVLVKHKSELLRLQTDSDQLQLWFSYPMGLSLPTLVKELKTVSSDFLNQALQSADRPDALSQNREQSFGEALIWSDAYSITSCEGASTYGKESTAPAQMAI